MQQKHGSTPDALPRPAEPRHMADCRVDSDGVARTCASDCQVPYPQCKSPPRPGEERRVEVAATCQRIAANEFAEIAISNQDRRDLRAAAEYSLETPAIDSRPAECERLRAVIDTDRACWSEALVAAQNQMRGMIGLLEEQEKEQRSRAEAAEAALATLRAERNSTVLSFEQDLAELREQLATAQRGHVVEVEHWAADEYGVTVNGTQLWPMVTTRTGCDAVAHKLRAALGSPRPVREHVVEVRHEGVWWTVHLNGKCLVPMSAISEQTAERAAQEIRAALNGPVAKVEDAGAGLLHDRVHEPCGKLLARKKIEVPAPARGYLLQLGDRFLGLHWDVEASKDRKECTPYPSKQAALEDRSTIDTEWRRARIVRAAAPKCWVVREGKVRGEGLYFSWSHHAVGGWFVSTRESRWGFPAYAEAKAAAGSTGRIVAVYAKKVKP